MPREATITYDQVVRYAESIKAEGRKPTPRLIRDKHGSGSYGTIHKLFQQWEGAQALVIETALSLPPSLQRSILEFVRSETVAAHARIRPFSHSSRDTVGLGTGLLAGALRRSAARARTSISLSTTPGTGSLSRASTADTAAWMASMGCFCSIAVARTSSAG